MSIPTGMPTGIGWPPRPATSTRSCRVFITGTTTPLFSDNAILFSTIPGANTVTPTPSYPNPQYQPAWGVSTTAGTTMQSGVPMVGATGMAYGIPTGTTFTIQGPSGTSYTGLAADPPIPMLWGGSLRVVNDGGSDLDFSFDGLNVHGIVRGGEDLYYYDRYEAGIALRTTGAVPTGTVYRVEAW